MSLCVCIEHVRSPCREPGEPRGPGSLREAARGGAVCETEGVSRQAPARGALRCPAASGPPSVSTPAAPCTGSHVPGGRGGSRSPHPRDAQGKRFPLGRSGVPADPFAGRWRLPRPSARLGRPNPSHPSARGRVDIVDPTVCKIILLQSPLGPPGGRKTLCSRAVPAVSGPDIAPSPPSIGLKPKSEARFLTTSCHRRGQPDRTSLLSGPRRPLPPGLPGASLRWLCIRRCWPLWERTQMEV